MQTDQLFDAAVSIWGGGSKSFKKVRKLKIGVIRLKLRLQLSLELSLMLSLMLGLKTRVIPFSIFKGILAKICVLCFKPKLQSTLAGARFNILSRLSDSVCCQNLNFRHRCYRYVICLDLKRTDFVQIRLKFMPTQHEIFKMTNS